MIHLKNSAQIAEMKEAGRITGEALLVARDMIRPGISTFEVDAAIRRYIEKCGAALYVRADDAAETVKNRLSTFHAQTEPLKDFYQAKGLLVTVEGQEEVADTTRLTFEALSRI